MRPSEDRFKRLEDVHVQRHGVADDLLEELLASFGLAVKKHRLVRLLGVPPKFSAVGTPAPLHGRDLF